MGVSRHGVKGSADRGRDLLRPTWIDVGGIHLLKLYKYLCS